MALTLDNVIQPIMFTVLGGVLGLVFMILGVLIVPKIVNKLTPNIDEEREIIKGNIAVARYFGGLVQSVILGMSIIIAAAIVAGIHGW